jgi:DNA mismatch repair protein MutL
MSDIIKLLPDALANQIAAGEVVQRPSSVVKELLENAIDAGADQITLTLTDGGKVMVKVSDNGMGMSPTDARMSFERHATSKLSSSKDLFNIHTMGFRGEALASIAAVAQVEMNTRTENMSAGTRIRVEGSKITTQEMAQMNPGTTIEVKNLFFNIPARRNFLKSIEIEKKHCIEEFNRIALAYPLVRFTLIHNKEVVTGLLPGKLKHRIGELIKGNILSHLLKVKEEAGDISILGYIGTPEQARKSRGDQYFFVNKRFIKSAYLNHAVQSAYESLLPDKHFPFYAIFIECPPESIDVNVHPTKQEIKFEEEQLIYNYLRSAVKHTLAVNFMVPMIDFDKDQQLMREWDKRPAPEATQARRDQYRIPGNFHKENTGRWQDLYDNLKMPSIDQAGVGQQKMIFKSAINDQAPEAEETLHPQVRTEDLIQLHDKYILCPVKSGLILIDQNKAHQRILYDEFTAQIQQDIHLSQSIMFPVIVSLDAARMSLINIFIDKMNMWGFQLAVTAENTLEISGVPAFADEALDWSNWMEDVLHDLEMNVEVQTPTESILADAYARKSATPAGKRLSQTEMRDLVDRLFACAFPSHTVNGDRCFTLIPLVELEKYLK